MRDYIPAIYDSGVFRPLEPVDLVNGTHASVIPLHPPKPTTQDGSADSSGWPAGYFEQTSGALAGEDFDRPPQGELPSRSNW
jgi:hypothetical protein